ncbi:Tryptophan synthase beta subunit-like PLP-dependent enzyme [Sesbania bispinosa]|nr:Tryptophan synthase beta subunit-like PLP-dependent enzyme [Sesbania bispinosa]
MEALRFSAPNPSPPLLRRHPFRKTHQTSLRANPRPKPLISATLSKPAEIATSPSPSSVEDPLSSLPPPRLRASPDSLQYPPGYVGAIPDRSRSDVSDGIISAMCYLTNILSSKVYDVAIESPLQLAPKLSERLGVNVWLKREDLQPVFSFKLRGAYNMMAKLPEELLEKGVICSSAGNHAQGVALAAKRLKCNAVIAMPVTTPEIKWKSVERLGATVVLIGDSYDEAQAYAKKRAKEEGRTFIPPFDHPDVIMGQGTVGMEIVRQMQGPVHASLCLWEVVVSLLYKYTGKIIGVEPTDANAMALSLHHGQRVILDQVGGFADGVAVKEVGEETFRICNELIDAFVLVSRDSICASIKLRADQKFKFEREKEHLRTAGALALAGAEAYCKVVTELANVGRKQEAVLATVMPEEPGSFKQFCELVGQMNITEFKYRYSSNEKAVVLYSLRNKINAGENGVFSQLKTFDLTESDLVKDHLRYLMGGRSNVQNEVLCRFTFPERPGALMKFLDSFSPRWNISLFHYRGEGETGANILVGIQVPKSEMDEFHERANRLGYDYKVVTNDDDFQLLMH